MALIVSLAALVTLFLIYSGAVEQEATPTDSNEITADDVNRVARELWCPLCNGVRLDACELIACTQMKEMIALQLAEGADVESIKAYFVEQYGPQVLGEPPREGFNWLAWILPVIVVALGGVFVWRQTQRMMKPATETTLDSGVQGNSTPEAGTSPEDEYDRKLEEELSRYG